MEASCGNQRKVESVEELSQVVGCKATTEGGFQFGRIDWLKTRLANQYGYVLCIFLIFLEIFLLSPFFIFFYFSFQGKPRGLRTARKLKNHRRDQRWHDKDYKKSHLGTRWKANPFSGASHAKGIVLEKVYVRTKCLRCERACTIYLFHVFKPISRLIDKVCITVCIYIYIYIYIY